MHFPYFLTSLLPYLESRKANPMSSKQNFAPQCQYQNARGQRCHMLIDEHHRSANAAARPTLCAYHAQRLKAAVPVVDPEVLAAELLTDIDSFTTADEVNLFLGNLVRQLARKRIARRDAIALAYISQLILTSQTAMARQRADEPETESVAVLDSLIAGLRQRSSELASRANQQSAAAVAPSIDNPQRAA